MTSKPIWPVLNMYDSEVFENHLKSVLELV